MEQDFQKLIFSIRSYNPNADFILISKAWEFCKLAHTGQKRLSGEPFVMHPLCVAEILSEWRLDTTSIVAGLLHDTIEDGGAKREDIVKLFGKDVATLVDGVTKVAGVHLGESQEQIFQESLRKMILVMAKDLRVVLVKLADRLHNMRTLSALPKEKQIRSSKETLEIYAPLAERLGIGEVKGELEDLAFPYLYRGDYAKLKKLSKPFYGSAEKRIGKMKRTLLVKLKHEEIDAQISGRKKHFYSLWKKLSRPEISWDFEQVNDVIALRILVNTIPECYTALGVVHATYKPVPKIGISDFIAQPKPNGYRSIHTKVFGPIGHIVEVQIRTFQMHEEAEHGLAAHWAYSEQKSKGVGEKKLENVRVENKLSWVQKLVDWQKEIKDSDKFLEAVKIDGFNHRNFVFSPKGDVYDLPRYATPVDFAYAVHTGLGNFLTGAKVNGKMVPLSYKLKSGDVVEILKSKNAKKPSRDWLKFVVTTETRREIAKFHKKGD